VESYSTFESVPQLLRHRAEHEGGAVAVVFEGESITYAELDTRAAAVHAWLEARGVVKGDHVAMLMSNSLEFLYVWFGIARAGAVAVPVNTSSVGEALRYTLWHSDSAGLFTDADLAPAVDGIEAVEALRWQVAVGDRPGSRIPFADVAATTPAEHPVEITGSDPMNIIYTSGTTGMPKGVVLSHTSYLNTGAYWVQHFGLTTADNLHTCLPLFHCNAQMTTFMGALSVGSTAYLNRKFSLSNFWRWIDESQASMTSLLGAMLVLLAKSEGKPTDAQNSLKFINGAPLPDVLHPVIEKRFGLRVVEGYGLTETGCVATYNPIDDRRPGTFGLPLTYNELKIIDEDGAEVGPGVPGQIITRTSIPDSYMTCYYKEPDKTAEVMKDGWFHTGDAGMKREDGWFVFLDRMKDTIRRRGENISSYLVEKIIGEHVQVQEVAAVGVPSELSEDDVKVFIVRQPGATLTEAELSEWCTTKLSDFMQPRYIQFVEAFPRTETGRVQKFELRRDGVGGAWDRDAHRASR
jgi:carnitine-CoA ligase